MSHDPVSRLNAALEGRYSVEHELGEGGMATVYLADDLRHGRKVALKVLKPELAAVVGAERFLAEIRTTANLQHPHILPLFDSGEAAGFLFYVMPYVEGESLRQRLEREHQLPVEDAVRIATNVAEALDYAHRHEVIHRDIKPANVLLHEGKPVISDFGIALAVGAAGGGRLTETGLSLGTPHYMSPEQATGDQNVGPTTDIYSLGCVLYEMLVGDPPFTGSTAQAVLGKIVTGDAAPVTEHRKSVPPNVDAAIRKALEKLPADRFTSAARFAEALGDPLFSRPSVTTGLRRRQGPGRTWTSRQAGLAATAALIIGAAVGWSLRGPAPRPVQRLAISFPDDQQPIYTAGATFTFTPDGRAVVYAASATASNAGQIYYRSLDALEGRSIAGTENGYSPRVSPSGATLSFLRATEGPRVWLVSLDGGPPTVLTDSLAQVRWGSDGLLYGTHRSSGGLARIDPTDATFEVLVIPDEAGITYRYPSLLPGGSAIVFTEVPADRAQSMIAVYDVERDEVIPLTRGFAATWVRSGHLVFVRDGVLSAVRFDAGSLTLTEPVVPLIENVGYGSGGAAFHTSPDGALLYTTIGEDPEGLFWLDRSGAERSAAPDTADFERVAISPDGSRIAVVAETDDRGHVYIHDRDGGARSQLTFEGVNEDPAWSSDGRWVAYRSVDRDIPGVYRRPWDGSAPEELLFESSSARNLSWSRDGRLLLFDEIRPGTARDVLAFDPAADSVISVLATSADEVTASLSPNNRWIAYASDETGEFEVWVERYPPGGGRWKISSGGAVQPRWARNGREIFFRERRTGDLWVAEVETESGFAFEPPRLLVRAASYEPDAVLWSYDVSPDGERSLLFRDLDRSQTVFLITNWTEELRRRVPN